MRNKTYKVIVEATEKVRVVCTVKAKNAQEARHKLTAPNPWKRTETEDELSRVELSNWKVIVAPKEVK